MNFDRKPTGIFQEKDKGNWFTYRPTNDQWALDNGFLHEIDVLDGVRFANVKKTVVYVCVDEDAYGKSVVERWDIKGHEDWTKNS